MKKWKQSQSLHQTRTPSRIHLYTSNTTEGGRESWRWSQEEKQSSGVSCKRIRKTEHALRRTTPWTEQKKWKQREMPCSRNTETHQKFRTRSAGRPWLLQTTKPKSPPSPRERQIPEKAQARSKSNTEAELEFSYSWKNGRKKTVNWEIHATLRRGRDTD